ncbi:MAG: carbamate kinase [Erysipelotrichaceae bacterium]|nr:carbamate kinase [Erysipelotrichaceae bacterium]MBQ5805504.1 carbamate kinase [Erysipelotrichaceae bacterium]
MGKRLVIALGGNALGNTPKQQLELVKTTAATIVDLVEAGYDVVVGHGNGPQVGMVNLAFENSHNNSGSTPEMPFPECGAMTQGYIGYHLQQSIGRELNKRGISKPVATVVTQVEVDRNDPAFQNPTKPIGSFYAKEEADRIMEETGYSFVEDSGRGYRRVVPSPKPVSIVELETIERLVSEGCIVITVGGGGIPVVKSDGWFEGVAAVIDKDRASAKLALDLHADMLVILTAVEKVSINFNKPNQIDLDEMSLEEAERYIKEGHFAKGSMLPKVESCIDYLEQMKTGKALITSLEKAKEALQGKTGTIIHP